MIPTRSNKKRKVVDLSDTDTDTDAEIDSLKIKKVKVDETDENDEIIIKDNDKYVCKACNKKFISSKVLIIFKKHY